MTDCVRDNSFIILLDNSKNKRVYQMQKDKMICHYKHNICCNELIGKPFNTFWQLDGLKLIEIADQKKLVEEFFLKVENDEDQDEDENEQNVG